MSILGLICVLLALVATLLFVLFLFQRRDLRAVSQLSLTVQRALSGERLPQRIEIDRRSRSPARRPGARRLGQPAADARRAHLEPREVRAETVHRARRAHPRSGARASRRDPVRQQPVRELRRRRSRQPHRSQAVRPGRARIRRPGRREPAPPPGRRARRRTLRGRDGRPAGPGEPARANYRADRIRGSAGAAGDRRRGHPDQEAARHRQRQDRREGSRRARRAGGAAAAATAAARRRRCRCSRCSRWPRPS